MQQSIRTSEVVNHRLTPEAYAALSRQLTGIAVTNDTSPMQAGYQLGIQHVLKLLREGFVLGA